MLTVEILQDEKKQIEKQLAAVEPLRKRLVALNELIQTYASDESQPLLLDAKSVAPQGRFKTLGTTEAIIAFLRESPEKFSSPREIAKGLIAGGHEAKSPNFFNIVYTICKRKGGSGEFQLSEQSGKKAFRLK